MKIRKLFGAGAIIGAGLVAWPGIAMAHAFGARHDLPLPLWAYLAGAAAAVVASFLVAALFMRRSNGPQSYRSWILPDGLSRILTHGSLRICVQLIGVALFILVLASGFFGTESTTKNFAPTFIWVIWWVGFAFVQALIGDLWALLNPWRTLFAWFEALFKVRGLCLNWPYPRWLGSWPAVAFFWAYVWFELIPDSSQEPASLALAVTLYSAITWIGMLCFGRETWLRHGEAFTLFFGFLARFAPVVSPSEGETEPKIALRPYAVGLLVDRPLAPSTLVFVILMLSSVTFDGFVETPPWSAFLAWLVESAALRPLLLGVRDAGFDLLAAIKTTALVVFPFLFLLFYQVFAWLTALMAGAPRGRGVAAGSFILTLVPIAIAYHLAHYFSFLLLAGQYIVPLASDPFGVGWNLFGTAQVTLDPGLISAKLVWWIAALAILVGHLAAVYLAHATALRLYADAKAALKSQIPMLILMVCYTMTSLWIIAQPIVKNPSLLGQ